MGIIKKHEELNFSIVETSDEELGIVTIAVDELPGYGEGNTREEAVNNMIDFVIEYCSVCSEDKEFLQRQDPLIVTKLLACKGDRAALCNLLGL